MIQENSQVPEVVFKTRIRDENVEGENKYAWKDLSTEEIFANKKIVLFALPGAFTPTCSSTHLPGYEARYQEMKDMGIDEVVCLSVNDAFTMFKWGQDLGRENVFMLPDGNAEFTEKMGALVEKSNLGFGKRSWRYSMFVDNGEIKKIFSEEGQCDNHGMDPFEVSGADTMVEYLKENL